MDPIEPLWEIVELHLEEAEFLAESWSDALAQPDYTLDELAEGPEARLLAHLDGLALAGPEALERLCWPALDDEPDASMAMAAGLTILNEGSLDDCARLLERLDLAPVGAKSDEAWSGLVDALALSWRPRIDTWLIDQLGRSGVAGPRTAGLAHALARRRVALGDRLNPLLRSTDPTVLRAAATLARRGDARQLHAVAALGQHDDPQVVAAAIETALVHQLPGAWASARYWAFDASRCEFRERALTWLALGDELDDHRRLLALLGDPSRRRGALWALGFCGRVAAVDAVLAYLADPELGRLAGELVTAIAGLPTDEDALWRDEPSEDDAAEPSLDESLELDPEDFLPIPDPDAVIEWWTPRREGLHPDTRWIAGQPFDAAFDRALREQPLRRRHALGLQAQVRSSGRMWLATCDWASAQLAELREA